MHESQALHTSQLHCDKTIYLSLLKKDMVLEGILVLYDFIYHNFMHYAFCLN